MATQEAGNPGERWQGWGNLVLGVWLFISPFIGIGVTNDIAAWNSYVAGLVVAVFAIAALAHRYLWEEWLNLIIGIWIVVSPFMLHFTAQTGPTWNLVIAGLLIATDAGRAVFRTQGRHEHGNRPAITAARARIAGILTRTRSCPQSWMAPRLRPAPGRHAGAGHPQGQAGRAAQRQGGTSARTQRSSCRGTIQ